MTQSEQSSFVWVVTKHDELVKIWTNGKTEVISDSIKVTSISFNVDETLWIVPKSSGPMESHVSYSEDEGKNWVRVNTLDLQIAKVSATHIGSCFILTLQGAIYLVQKTGEVKQIFDDETAHDMAVSPEGYIWIISRISKEGGGNLVFWCALDNYVLQPPYGQPVAKRISVGPEGTARIVTIGDEVASIYLNRMGGLETPGGEAFAKDIATSCMSNTIWAISVDKIKKKKYHKLKFWNPDSDAFMQWHTVPDVEPVIVASGN